MLVDVCRRPKGGGDAFALFHLANLHGRRWPFCVFDEVTTEAVALRLSFDLWRDVAPCWMGRVQKRVKLSPVEALLRECGAPMTRDEYILWNSLGKNTKLAPEEEAELPPRFQERSNSDSTDEDPT